MFKAGDKVKFHHWVEGENEPLWVELTGVYQRQSERTKYHCVLSNDGSVYYYTEDVELLDPYVTYDGGKPQYDADLATLDAAAKYATGGRYEDGSLFYSQEIQANALDVASAWARMATYLKGKGVL